MPEGAKGCCSGMLLQQSLCTSGALSGEAPEEEGTIEKEAGS